MHSSGVPMPYFFIILPNLSHGSFLCYYYYVIVIIYYYNLFSLLWFSPFLLILKEKRACNHCMNHCFQTNVKYDEQHKLVVQ